MARDQSRYQLLMDAAERQMLEAYLQRAGTAGQRRAVRVASEMLGITYEKLSYRIRTLGITAHKKSKKDSFNGEKNRNQSSECDSANTVPGAEEAD